ncbi:MAG: protein-L-isoaspartate O-methyltransferase [Pseudomonadota bacterium]
MDFAQARDTMVETQLRTNKVVDPQVIAAFAETPREIFAPPGRRAVAYTDEDLSLGGGRWLTAPMTLARLVQAAAATPHSIALVVGAATGYAAAILSKLAQTVFAMDVDRDALTATANAWAAHGFDNIVVVDGHVVDGAPDHAPFDVILIDGAVETEPKTLLGQLADGGRLACVRREAYDPAKISGLQGGVGRAGLYTKAAGVIGWRTIFDAHTPLSPGFGAQREFAL